MTKYGKQMTNNAKIMTNMANNTKNGNQIVKGTLYKTCKYTMKTL